MTDPGRKFYLSILILVVFGIFVGLGLMPVTEYKDLAIWVLGLFSAGNVVQKFAQTTLRKQV